MGVLGLTPFLLKNCPEVIKKLPDRLQSFKGKTIVIDGTLITQRLHFASMPYEHRHVLGWYKILQEFKDSGVGAICVFDGQERNQAKARENARRKEVQKLAQARGAIEADRSKRLRKLIGLVEDYRFLQTAERERATSLLKEVVSNAKHGALSAIIETKKKRQPLGVANEMQEAAMDIGPLVQTHDPPHPISSTDFESVDPSYDNDNVDSSDFDLRHTLLARIGQSISTSQVSLSDLEWLKDQREMDDNYTGMVTNELRISSRDNLLDDVPTMVEEDLTPEVPYTTAEVTKEETNIDLSMDPNTTESNVEDPKSQRNPGTAENQDSDSATRIRPTVSNVENRSLASMTAEISSMMGDIQLPESRTSTEVVPLTQVPGASSSPSETQLFAEPESAAEGVHPPIRTEDIPAALASLYLEYCQSIPQLTSLSPSEAKPSLSQAANEDPSEEQSEFVMSRTQLQLTVDEGKVWDELVAAKQERMPSEPSIELPEDATQANLVSLAEKSNLISVSYERRNNPPTTRTYEESKEIIRALGVPCVDSGGAYEAEAVAASLVLNGHADYVASEDTDVLVYEAPLIRNITSRLEPITIVSGADIRTVLQLDRASFVDFALLLGTDFSQRIKNVGPQRALKFIREHGSIEQIIERERKYSPRLPEKAYLEQVEIARLVFQTLPPVPPAELLHMKESQPELVASILQKYGLHQVVSYEWDHGAALDGNYFQDNPRAF